MVRLRGIRGALAAMLAVWAATANARASIDPEGSGVIVSAVNWLQGTLLGTVATVAAVIAGWLHDAHGPGELAPWRGRDPRLLHPVRRGKHRRRHPVDGRLGALTWRRGSIGPRFSSA